MKSPLDPTPYERDPRSQSIHPGVEEGRYVYAQDEQDVIWIIPDDRPHLHPQILGQARPAKYAGDLTVRNDKIADLTNCSGTFHLMMKRDCDGSGRSCPT